jgi:DNA (cytosine-5)-methyltransferase 1
MGYYQAGFDVTGVDIAPQKHYPFAFIQADALEYSAERGREYDIIHASPPCQGYSRLMRLPWMRDRQYPMLIEDVRTLLRATGRRYVIENVVGAPLIDPLTLCGAMFGLKVYRHRLFESNVDMLAPCHAPHRDRLLKNHGPSPKGFIMVAGNQFRLADGSKAMGIDWMTCRELSQAIPPAYTRWIGEQLYA